MPALRKTCCCLMAALLAWNALLHLTAAGGDAVAEARLIVEKYGGKFFQDNFEKSVTVTWETGASLVTDAAIQEMVPALAKVKELKSLFLGGAKITDVSLKELAQLRQLQHVDLQNTKVT